MKWTQQNSDRRESARVVEDTAAAARYHGFLEQDIESLSPEELAKWADWSEDEARLEKIRSLDRIWRALDGTVTKESGPRPALSAVAPDQYDGEELRISEWLAQGSRPARKRWRPGRFTIVLAAAACMVGAAVIATLLNDDIGQRPPNGDQVQSFSTAASEHRSIDLSDGSHITIGGRTELTVHYTAKRRFVFLDHGEASFTVTHDTLRPFQVFAGGGTVTAIGTQFDVRREVDPAGDIEQVIVTVSSGTVEVGPPSESPPVSSGSSEPRNTKELSTKGRRTPPAWTAARLMKGQELTYSSDGPKGEIEGVNLEEASAWKEGRLEYRHTPFRDVIPRVNRYSQKRIVLADDGVADLPYSGSVFEGQVEDWLSALQKTYPIDVTDEGDHFVLRHNPAREASLE